MSILDDAYALISFSTRAIGVVIPNVVVDEVNRDQLVITTHPVEQGASISDHAFKMPAQVEMRCAWSDSTGGYVGYSKQIYLALQTLQQVRQPFSVFTGKRAYSNMLVQSLEITTNEQNENALFATIGLQEVIIVSTSTTTVANGNQASAAKTAGTATSGTKQATYATPYVGPQ
ncbi:MAG: hypothetical protein PW791_09205 [Neorhizobium sp.]|jgi:hypothetical protein|nr:hypothetical protein [Neorhizobium sp.]